jgi:chemotaxis protein methyltransferase CheR
MIRFQPQHFDQIRRFIHEFSGILLERAPLDGVRDRIKRHVEAVGVSKVSEYVELLANPGSISVRDELLSLVTVNESFFFRNPAQFRFLAEFLFPAMHAEKIRAGCKQITLWSAGCATGEEAYSLAFLVDWYCRRCPGINFNLIGTDLNVISLEKARAGYFRKRSLRQAYATIRAEYPEMLALKEMESEGRGAMSIDGSTNALYRVPPEICDQVQFRFFNLKEQDKLDMMKRTDIIFCRNVLIYFDDEFRRSLIERFHSLLNPGGYLFLGETESIPHHLKCFELIPCCGGFCYRKAANHETH